MLLKEHTLRKYQYYIHVNNHPIGYYIKQLADEVYGDYTIDEIYDYKVMDNVVWVNLIPPKLKGDDEE